MDIKQRTKVREGQELRVHVLWCICVLVLSMPAGAWILYLPYGFQWDFDVGNTSRKQTVR